MFDKKLNRWNVKGSYKSLLYEYKNLQHYIKKEVKNGAVSFVDIGHGMGDVLDLIKGNFKNLELSGIDISQEMVDLVNKKGCQSKKAEITKIPFPDNSFDIVHCSHVIEHLGYPEITIALEELFRIVKPSGVVIIRAPLENPNFCLDIDHIRAYPPEAILNYFSLIQQQKKSLQKISLVGSWYCNKPPLYSKRTSKRTLKEVLIMVSWKIFRRPCNLGCQYGAVFKKGLK